jgi:hypothetical protein
VAFPTKKMEPLPKSGCSFLLGRSKEFVEELGLRADVFGEGPSTAPRRWA